MRELAPVDQERYDVTAEVINSTITPDLIHDTLMTLHDPAPSGTVLYTRTPQLQQLVLEVGIPSEEFDERIFGTRSPAVFLRSPKSWWFEAHSDTVSYLFPKVTNEITSAINVNCAHRPKVAREWAAVVLRYNERLGKHEIVSNGVIGSELVKDKYEPYYTAHTKPKNGFDPGFDRVVFAPQLLWNTDSHLVTGNMDNTAGMAIMVAAMYALYQVARKRKISMQEFPIAFLFPDEEEGFT